jgi:tRNA (guanine37-N1)-methyltransferase
VEAVSRQISGVLGNAESLREETFGTKKNPAEKEYLQYTRPEDFMGMKVPKVLVSGDHKKIAEWRKGKQK